MYSIFQCMYMYALCYLRHCLVLYESLQSCEGDLSDAKVLGLTGKQQWVDNIVCSRQNCREGGDDQIREEVPQAVLSM